MPTLLAILTTCLLVFLVPVRALAVMPPHVRSFTPENGGVVTDGIVTIVGYSLGFVDPEQEIVVLDVRSQEPVPFTVTMDCVWEGEGDAPGARQQRCTIEVFMDALVPGQEYELRFLDEVMKFTFKP
ncbi:MAG: hypothetical protein D6E12_02175 [Desulfovibrio sp.]|mgnify:CR=1 FL=1|nr:MAG: hypothetical protein D6E12_02175 [Desulfovibrio sp.]